MTHKIDYKTASAAAVTEDLGRRLARLRLARNITQQDLAARAGVSERTIKRFEAGHGASVDTLIRLMQALGLEAHLLVLLPDPGIQPLEHLERGGQQRQRARPSSRPSKTRPWSWDEEQTP